MRPPGRARWPCGERRRSCRLCRSRLLYSYLSLLFAPPLSGADQMNDLVLAMKTLDREAKTIRSIDHARKLDGTVGRVVGRAFDLECGRAGNQAEEFGVLLATNHLDGAGGSGGHDAVELFHRLVEGSLGEVGLQNFGEGSR